MFCYLGRCIFTVFMRPYMEYKDSPLIYGYASRRSQLIPVIFSLILIRLPRILFQVNFHGVSHKENSPEKGINRLANQDWDLYLMEGITSV